jgi:O-antigen/teichoic acid export membrane protein
VRYRWNFATVKKLFLVGSPIFAVGYLQVIFLALPATLIVKSLGSAYLGLFQPALFLEAGVLVLVNAVSQILYVRMLETYAQTGSIGATCLMSVKPVIFLGLVLLPVALVGWLGTPWFISTFLPKYTAGIPAAKWMVVSAYLEFLNPVLNMFAVIRKMGIYFLIMTAGVLAFFAVINLGIWPAADPLVPYALARIAGRAVILFLGLGVIFTLARKTAHAK